MMEATWEVYYEAHRLGQPDKRYHVFSMSVIDVLHSTSSEAAAPVAANASLSATQAATILSVSEASLVSTGQFSTRQERTNPLTASSANLLNVSQAIENDAPFWAATIEAKQAFKARFGYDPEDVYRPNSPAYKTYRSGIHETLTSDYEAPKSSQRSVSKGKFKKYKASGQANEEVAIAAAVDIDDELNVRDSEDITNVQIVSNQNEQTKKQGNGKYSKYKKYKIDRNLHDSDDNLDRNGRNDGQGSSFIDASNAATSSTLDVDIFTEPSDSSTTTTKPNTRYHYHELCEPYSVPPLDPLLNRRLQAVLEERKRNLQRIKKRQHQIANNPRYNLENDPENKVIHHADNLIYLNIGGLRSSNDWINVNADEASFKGLLKKMPEQTEAEGDPIVHVKRQMNDLRGFPNASVAAIYASHILEHNTFGDRMIVDTLLEWRRVLRPGGLLFISVPDLTILSKLFLMKDLSLEGKFFIMNMMYGAQKDAYDHHHIGLDEDMLNLYLTLCGFCEMERVGEFNLFKFQDTSSSVFGDYAVSLNIVAKSCPSHLWATLNIPTEAFFKPSEKEEYDELNMSHSASEYVPQDIPLQ